MEEIMKFLSKLIMLGTFGAVLSINSGTEASQQSYGNQNYGNNQRPSGRGHRQTGGSSRAQESQQGNNTNQTTEQRLKMEAAQGNLMAQKALEPGNRGLRNALKDPMDKYKSKAR
jgi:hypothetical protein